MAASDRSCSREVRPGVGAGSPGLEAGPVHSRGETGPKDLARPPLCSEVREGLRGRYFHLALSLLLSTKRMPRVGEISKRTLASPAASAFWVHAAWSGGLEQFLSGWRERCCCRER